MAPPPEQKPWTNPGSLTWQNHLFKVVGAAAFLGTFLLLGLIMWQLVFHTGDGDGAAKSAGKPIILIGCTSAVCLIAGIFREREMLAEKLPKWNCPILPKFVQESTPTLTRMFPVLLCCALVIAVVPVDHLLFLLFMGVAVFASISILKSLEMRVRCVAVCDAIYSLLFTEAMRRNGGWFDGCDYYEGRKMAAWLFMVYGFTSLFCPLTAVLITFQFLPKLARLLWFAYALLCAHIAAVILMACNLYVDEFSNGVVYEPNMFQGGACIESQAYSIVGLFLLGFDAATQGAEYSGPPALVAVRMPCITPDIMVSPLDENASAAAMELLRTTPAPLIEDHLHGFKCISGQPAFVFLILAAIYFFAVLVFILNLRTGRSRVSPEGQVVQSPSGRLRMSFTFETEEDAKACTDGLKWCLKEAAKSTVRLIVLIILIISGISLFSLFIVVVLKPITDNMRRLSERSSIAEPMLFPTEVEDVNLVEVFGATASPRRLIDSSDRDNKTRNYQNADLSTCDWAAESNSSFLGRNYSATDLTWRQKIAVDHTDIQIAIRNASFASVNDSLKKMSRNCYVRPMPNSKDGYRCSRNACFYETYTWGVHYRQYSMLEVFEALAPLALSARLALSEETLSRAWGEDEYSVVLANFTKLNLELCQAFCMNEFNCTGVEWPSDGSWCTVWFNGACDVVYGDNIPGWHEWYGALTGGWTCSKEWRWEQPAPGFASLPYGCYDTDWCSRNGKDLGRCSFDMCRGCEFCWPLCDADPLLLTDSSVAELAEVPTEELRDRLDARGLPSNGTKADLVARLQAESPRRRRTVGSGTDESTTTTTTPQPDDAEARAKAKWNIEGHMLGRWTYSSWASIPVGQVRTTWCELGPLSPILFWLSFYICRCYLCSLVGGVATEQNNKKQLQIRRDKRRKSREAGISVQELEQRRREKLWGRFKMQAQASKKHEPDPAPVEYGVVHEGRMFSV